MNMIIMNMIIDTVLQKGVVMFVCFFFVNVMTVIYYIPIEQNFM